MRCGVAGCASNAAQSTAEAAAQTAAKAAAQATDCAAQTAQLGKTGAGKSNRAAHQHTGQNPTRLTHGSLLFVAQIRWPDFPALCTLPGTTAGTANFFHAKSLFKKCIPQDIPHKDEGSWAASRRLLPIRQTTVKDAIIFAAIVEFL
jgi:hypothetical protein